MVRMFQNEEFGGQILVIFVRQLASLREGIFVTCIWHLEQCLMYNLITVGGAKFLH